MLAAKQRHAMPWLQLHFCVLLWGFTAIIGKLIQLRAVPLVWWRVLMVAAVLLPVPQLWRGLRRLSRRQSAVYLGIGVLVGLHWVTFYASIKLANASVAATTLALAPMFVAFVEPWLMKQRIKPMDLGLGIVVLVGVTLVVGGIPPRMYAGLIIGVLSAALVALFGTLNKRHVLDADALTVTWLEMSGAWLFLSAAMPLLAASERVTALPNSHDALLLLLLSFGCTLLPFALALRAMRQVSAFGAQLTIALEPVYAIALSMLWFGEQRELQARFYLGVLVVLAAVFAYPLLHRERTVAPPLLE